MHIRWSFKLAPKIVLFSSLWLILSMAINISHAYGGAGAVRIIHAVVDVPAADVYLDKKLLGTVDYGNAAPYLALEPGEHQLQLYVPGQGIDSTPLFEKGFTLPDDTHLNLVLMGTSIEPRMEVYPIDRTPLHDNYGASHINLINVVPGNTL
ncbi:MAG TPA: DUF4397 domain-containing protein, partial [Phototrophicaceae bacterium]|nr:DUF4397 domain-containing protein [Phototrophicaceae bacterium]